MAVGDIMLGDSAKCIGIGLRSATQSGDASAIFAHVKGYMTGDIVFGNLECVLSDHDYNGLNFKKAQMRGIPSSINAVKDAGFTLLNVANNHTLQYGATGFMNTCRVLEEAGIGIVGVRGDAEYLCRPFLQEIRGKKVGILGYALEKDQYYSGRTLYAQGSDDDIAGDVSRLRRICDYVVVSMHWGDEFVAAPSETTINLARKLTDAGAHTIIGHHPHVVQGIEEYESNAIIYSLGNFISDMAWDDTLTNGIATEIIFKNGTSRIGRIYRSCITKDYSVHISGSVNLAEFQQKLQLDRNNPGSYSDEVNRVRVLLRNKSHCYVFRNAYKYNPLIFLQIIFNSLKSLLYGLVRKFSLIKPVEE